MQHSGELKYQLQSIHPKTFCLLPVSYLLMVSSSSESQKLVVSSSLLITVLELSYPARWRSRRLWPFIRGPATEDILHEFSCLLKSLFSFFHYRLLTFLTSTFFDNITICQCLDVGRGPNLDDKSSYKSMFPSAFSHRVAPCPLCVEVSLSWRKLQTLFRSGRPMSPRCLLHWDCNRSGTVRIRARPNFNISPF